VPDQATKLQRWLDLIAFLVGRRYPVTVDDVFEGVPAYVPPTDTDDTTTLASSRKMFERDKKELREIGIPIETVESASEGGTVEGYRLRDRDFYLPYLRLLEEGGGAPAGGTGTVELSLREAEVARRALDEVADLPAFPLRQEARSTLRKLSFDLVLHGLDADPVLYAARPGEEEVRHRLRTLTAALTSGRRVRFRYHGIYRGKATDRDVAGYGLFFQRGHWYWIGHDALRDAVRVFRVDRMEDVEETKRSYEVPGDFDLSAYRDREAWELGGGDEAPLSARVRFAFPRSLWAERNGRGTLVEHHPGGASVRLFEVHQVDPFLRWILSLEGDAEILDPSELRRAFHDLVAEVSSLYDPER